MNRTGQIATTGVTRITDAGSSPAEDVLAVEEPLEIRIAFDEDGERVEKSISITMRTPGEDLDLACGFLLSESILRSAGDIAAIHHCGPAADGVQNVVRVELREGLAIDYRRLERHFYTSSSCGVCGKSSIEALHLASIQPLPRDLPALRSEVIHALPERLRRGQEVFASTGGLHAAGLFAPDGELISVHEDVGRHNAVDKLVGRACLDRRLPLADRILMVSGRASFELVQKALAAGIPAMAAVGAPSSLAVDLARTWGMTLIGFVRDKRFNIYSGKWRLA
ncbi:MAG TPA: formate dehydrogenase accessory sulfurtransferase FdhD [Thermoanaerobaculia bacterium]|nr:formate dehydrogenase accessory sulfurtransferase FdhD [Thermoanaerobaculia bacterium]